MLVKPLSPSLDTPLNAYLLLAEGYYMKNPVVGLADRWLTHFRLRVNTVSVIAYMPFTMFSYIHFFILMI